MLRHRALHSGLEKGIKVGNVQEGRWRTAAIFGLCRRWREDRSLRFGLLAAEVIELPNHPTLPLGRGTHTLLSTNTPTLTRDPAILCAMSHISQDFSAVCQIAVSTASSNPQLPEERTAVLPPWEPSQVPGACWTARGKPLASHGIRALVAGASTDGARTQRALGSHYGRQPASRKTQLNGSPTPLGDPVLPRQTPQLSRSQNTGFPNFAKRKGTASAVPFLLSCLRSEPLHTG